MITWLKFNSIFNFNIESAYGRVGAIDDVLQLRGCSKCATLYCYHYYLYHFLHRNLLGL